MVSAGLVSLGGRERRVRRRWPWVVVVSVAVGGMGVLFMITMPGRSHSGPLPPLDAGEAALVAPLRRHVAELAGRIGERNVVEHAALLEAAAYVQRELEASGLRAARQVYDVAGRSCPNVEIEVKGSERPAEIVIAGAHYDSVLGCPGANDNATGVAALLVLARELLAARPARTLRLVAFVNEEPPYFQTAAMGSRVYARRCRERNEDVRAMVSLETIGCYSDAAGSQEYPAPFSAFYPSTGNFIALVGNLASRDLVRRAVEVFRANAAFPSEGGALPEDLPGIGWSDHDSFWREGYPAIMVTDTAPFRYPHYHLATDTPEKVDYERCARVVAGVGHVLRDLAGIPAR